MMMTAERTDAKPAKRVLKPTYVVPRYWPNMGGAEQHSREIVQRVARNHAPKVIRFCSTEPVATDYAYAHTTPSVSFDNTTPIHQWGAPTQLRGPLKFLSGSQSPNKAQRLIFRTIAERQLRQQFTPIAEQSDLFHAIYNGFTPAATAAAKADLPFVWTPLAHTTKPEGTAWSSKQFKSLYRRADALIAMTAYEKDWLNAQGADIDRIHVCPMAPLLSSATPDPARFRTKYDLGDDPIILFLGRLVSYKGYRELLGAAYAVWCDFPKARFVFAGPASSSIADKLRSMSDDRITYCGIITDEDKNDALAAAAMLCVPSTEESLGVVYFEAWHFNTPVIAANVPVMKTVIDNEVDGLLVDQSTDGIADAVRRLLADPPLAEAMGAAGNKKRRRFYNWDSTVSKLEEIYQSLV